MTDRQLISKTADFIKDKFSTESSGHDWWHMYRVWQLSKHIASKEGGADMLVVELAALLHDIEDHKMHGGDSEVGALAARKWLEQNKLDSKVIAHIEDIVRHISFKSAKIKNPLDTLEGKIVHDADKLDSIGAIGIARVFAFGGAYGRLIYSPDIKLVKDYTYKKTNASNSTAVHHFYEKLLLLKDRMFTDTGRQMAERRHKFMEQYLEEFYDEWDGKV
jgi:uncharacterized protein